MQIQSFSAPTLSEGYDRLRAEYGGDAVVLSTAEDENNVVFTVSVSGPRSIADDASEENQKGRILSQ